MGNDGFETDSLEAMSNDTIQSTSTSRFGNFKFNIKYDKDRGIDSFFRSIKFYCQMYNITDDSDKILLSLNALNSCESSDYAINILQRADYKNFEQFKNKISCVLGETDHSVHEAYHAFTR